MLGEQTTAEVRKSSTTVRAWAVCTNRACGAEREIPAERHTITQLGVEGVFKRIPVVETHHLEVPDDAYICQASYEDPQTGEDRPCGAACVVSEQPRREIPKYVI